MSGFVATSGRLAEWAEGRLVGAADRPIAGVATDSRQSCLGRAFFALSGPNFDAHAFADDAVRQGAAALIVEPGRVRAAVPVIEVADPLAALGLVARAYRRSIGAAVLGLTGSNGKTTTKEMIASVFAVDHRVHKTEGNLNNLVGLPLTVLAAPRDAEVLVLEMGMNRRGEIATMTEIAGPDVGLITNIGPAHVGELGSIEEVARAKLELFEHLAPTATRVVNLDDPRIVAGEGAHRGAGRVTFGSAADADVAVLRAEPLGSGQRVSLRYGGERLEVELRLAGRHNAMNAAAAAAVGLARGLSSTSVAAGLLRASEVKGRFVLVRGPGYDVVDDTYNANRASMLAALETARTLAGERRLVVALGEMRELGAFTDEEHALVARGAVSAGAAAIGSFGPLARGVAEVARAAGVPCHHEDADVEALSAWLRAVVRPGDLVLVKGSRGARMERVVAALRSAGEGD